MQSLEQARYLWLHKRYSAMADRRATMGNTSHTKERASMRIDKVRTTMSTDEAYIWIAISICMVLAATGCRQKAESPLQITLATQAGPYSGLIAVADEKDFFEKAGLAVKINLYPSGLDSLKAMMQGKAEVATAADIAFASTMAEDPSLRVIASIGSSMGSQIVARKDRNIHKPADLIGKKIGYSPNTSSHYFLHSFLLTHEISRDALTMVALPPSKQVESIVDGEIDAVSAFDVYAYPARKKLGDDAVAWNAQNNLDYHWLLVTRESKTRSPEAIARLLRAFILAETFVVNHSEETRSIIARKWDIDPDCIRELWNQTRLSVSFNQSVITSLQNYVKWRMGTEGRTSDLPDILSYLDTSPLEGLDPRLVTIFR